MKKSALLFAITLLACSASAFAQESKGGEMGPGMMAMRNACKADAAQFCKGVQPGQGRIAQCLAQNMDSLSDGCKAALSKAKEMHSKAKAARGAAGQTQQ